MGAGRHRLGRTGRRDDQRRVPAQAQGVHGRPVLDRERRRPRLRRAGQEGADADAGRDLPVLPRRGTAPRQCRTGPDEAVGHARRRRDARTQRQHPARDRVAGPLLRRHVTVGARHRHPDARGGTRRRTAQIPAGRGGRSGLPPGLPEDQQRRVPAHRRRLRGAEHDRPRQGPQAGRRLRRQHRQPGTRSIGDDHVRAAAQPDAQQHRRHGTGARAPLQGHDAVQGARQSRRIHLAGTDVSNPQAARAHGRQAATTRTTGWPTRWCGRRTRYPRRLLKPIPTWFKELTHEPAA